MRLPETDPDPFAPLPPRTQASSEPQARAGVPEGALCGVEHGPAEGHLPDHPAIALCGRCGTFACAEALSGEGEGEEGAAICLRCERSSFVVPWERRKELGLAQAFGRTWLGVLLHPGELFSARPREASRVPALAYGLLCSVVSNLLGLGLFLLFYDPSVPIPEEVRQAGLSWALRPSGQLLLCALAPLTFLLSVHLAAGLWWLSLRAVGGGRPSYDRLVRALAYLASLAFLAPLQQLPDPIGGLAFLGMAVGGLLLQLYAIKSAAGVELWRVIVALLAGAAVLLTFACVLSFALVLLTFPMGLR